ncbi:MAG: SRPBCC domain-containing protein [Hydrococcus sp. RU_2_2]|nr:SRPBCC domain-containing protein [Hydrococcus sp. RU_2_2]
MNFSPTIIKKEENRELRWKGKFIIPGIFDGEHIFILEESSERSVRFIHKEIYTGLLVSLMQKQLNNNTKQGFELMNQALKEKAESQRAIALNQSSINERF